MRLPSPRYFLCCAICLAACVASFAEDAAPESSPSSVDELFANPQADTVTAVSDAKQLFEPFHAQPLTVVGSLSTMAGGVIGFSDRPEATSGNGPYRLKVSPGMSFVPVMTFSARPDETVRFQGTTSFPFQSTSTFEPVINEVFIDYTLQDEIYVRIGKHLVSWGVTRIFDVPNGDLMTNTSSSSNYLNMKVTVPIATGGLTAITLAPSTVFDPPVSWKELIYGLQADVPILKSDLILSASCFGNNTREDAYHEPLNATAVFKTALLGADLFAEGVWASRLDTSSRSPVSPTFNGFVSGFYKSWRERTLTIYGEYYVDTTDESLKNQYISVVGKADKAFGSPLSLALQWTHAFRDGSGIITPGFSTGLLPHIKMQAGLPCRYGRPDSYYLNNPSPEVQTAIVPTTELKWYQRYGLLLRFTMDMSF